MRIPKRPKILFTKPVSPNQPLRGIKNNIYNEDIKYIYLKNQNRIPKGKSFHVRNFQNASASYLTSYI